MEIRRGIIEKHLDHVAAYIADHNSEPDDVTGYHDYIISMKKSATRQDELGILLLGIDCLLLDASLDAPSFAQLYTSFFPDEMEEFLKYIRSVAFPDAPPLNPETIKNVRIV
jgi:hypothetical protein